MSKSDVIYNWSDPKSRQSSIQRSEERKGKKRGPVSRSALNPLRMSDKVACECGDVMTLKELLGHRKTCTYFGGEQ